MLKTVKVPPQFEAVFAEAEKNVGEFFSSIDRDPGKGTIRIAGDRYILMRGESVFASLRDNMIRQFGQEVTAAFLYDLAKTVGHSDARRFAERLNLTDPVARLSAGPVHFSHTGWAFVEILPESAPSPGQDYVLVYNHPNTFESEIYQSRGQGSDRAVCVFSAGYSAGWCSFSFGLDLDAREVLCRTKDDPDCRFVMAPPGRLERRVEEYLAGI